MLVHPSDAVSKSGELTRSMFLDAPSADARARLHPRDRALCVLIEAGENPGDVGRYLLGVKGDSAATAARGVFERSVAESGIEPRVLRADGIDRLQRVLPGRVMRWGFLLRATQLLTETDIAGLLGVHRATVYRHLERATAALRAELASMS